MLKRKMIENPEVPGFETNFPPPPPPPSISKSEKEQQGKVQIEIRETPPLLMPPAVPIPPVINPMDVQPQFPIIPGPFYAPQIVQPPPPPPPPPPPTSEPLAWWIPTESDGHETYQWFDPNQQNINFRNSTGEKNKQKPIKRKSESIDPAVDAERVASAQRELSALMKPLMCDLCNAVMNSTLQAKLHYDGKPHQKKVSMFLNQSVKKVKTDDGQVTDASPDDWSTYCETCKTWFTSQTDAAQHYAGKKHIRATTGVAKQKSPKKNLSQVVVDPTGRFGIGLDFLPETQLTTPIGEVTLVPGLPQVSQVSGLPPASVYAPGATTYTAALRCELCGVSANRLEQLENHKRGTRHLKMLKQNGLIPTDTVAAIEIETTPAVIDYSIYRTPSGSYYCAPCNKSFNSESSFAQHVESKKHKTQIIPKAPTMQLAPKKEKSKKSHKSL